MKQSLSAWLASMPDMEVRVEALHILSQTPTRPWEEIARNAGFNVHFRRRAEIQRLKAENAKLRAR